MTVPARRAATAALAGLALVVVGGCSQTEDVPDAVGPASAYIDLVLGTSRELAAQQATEVEELIAACMSEAGFEYVPYPAGWVNADIELAESGQGTREFAEQYGYGYASQPESLSAQPTGDPNQTLFNAMSPAEREEYDLAYIGDRRPTTAAGDVVVVVESGPDGEGEQGCVSKAIAEVHGTGAVADATYLALADEIHRIEYEVIPTDARVVAADAAWSGCMADAGHPGYTHQPEAQTEWLDHWSAAGSGGGELDLDEAARQIAALAEEERALATADWDCRDETGYDDAVTAVRNALQQEYVDAHHDELDAWVERWAEG